MNNHSRNTRTLIASFAIAIMALIPLRMVEAGQMANLMEVNNPVVLGESVEVDEPKIEMKAEKPLLESPYVQIEESCIDPAEAELEMTMIESKLYQDGWSQEEVGEMLVEIKELEMRKCK
jgi:hypothetical protein